MATETVAAKNLTPGSRIKIGRSWHDVTEAPRVLGGIASVWLAPVDCPAAEWQQVYDADDAVTALVPLTAEQVYRLGKAQ